MHTSDAMNKFYKINQKLVGFVSIYEFVFSVFKISNCASFRLKAFVLSCNLLIEKKYLACNPLHKKD